MDERWIKYFENSLGRRRLLEYAVEHWNYSMQLYYQIRKLAAPPAKILEIGCGLGLSSIYLRECGYSVTAVDNNEEIAGFARRNAEMLSPDLQVECADAFDLKKYHGLYDLCFSVGVVEHFEKSETIKLLQEQMRCAQYVVAVVPSRFTSYAGKITDERIYGVAGLKKIFREAGFGKVSSFGYGDVPSKFHTIMKYILPLGAYRLLQNHFTFSMGIGCIGSRTGVHARI